MAFIEFKNVTKEYNMDEVKVKALKKASFEIEKGQLVIINGPSGAGKTTCLNILGGIDKLTNGNIIVDGVKINELKGRKLVRYRRNDVGFVFQSCNLIQNLTVKENVELSIQICKNPMEPIPIIKKVGLSKKMNNYPSSLLSSEQQKVAIARAIIKRPKLLLCDEIDSVLNDKNGKQVLKLLQETAKKEGTTIIIVTHNSAIYPIANKIITFKNGSVSEVKINKKPKAAGDLSW